MNIFRMANNPMMPNPVIHVIRIAHALKIFASKLISWEKASPMVMEKVQLVEVIRIQIRWSR